jgi:23S rRNA pseudouridine2457 synthase
MVLSQFSEEGEKQTLADYLSHLPKDVYPVGRLDYDSEGLLLLTNDKALTHRLLEPKFEHRRTYWVQVDGDITNEAIMQLCKGVIINNNGKDYVTKPAIAKRIGAPDVSERNPPIRYRKNIPTSWVSLTLTEGKNRQVRKMTAKVGFPTLRLIRYAIGNVTIDNLQTGECIETDARIVQKLMGS